ncbi:MAG: nucleotidyl transferase AbiEii/AbiGii toxin family protein [Syntrophaceae bacterium]|nr:nucleotidyl transferase AbiEii/AbiGii toxin family protein [Syntrophaceae bacterium]
MRDLIQHEQFELEVLSRLQSGRFLANLIFGGGTMLRLCHGLNRYSVDLDFWVVRNMDWAKYYSRMEKYLGQFYKIADSANKHFTILFELKSPQFPRSLKIEIRKTEKKVKMETSIAYSPHSTAQVMLKTVALEDMMTSKIEAFLDRREIRDAYDMEFMVKRGIVLNADNETVTRLLAGLEKLGKKDFPVKLGSLLDVSERKYYVENGFRILEATLREKLK